MKAQTWILVGAIALALAGPSPAHARKKDRDNEAAARGQTQEFVDARMHETLSSINRSLDVLVQLNRGGEPARAAGPIGATVAGAAGAPRATVVPPASAPPAALTAPRSGSAADLDKKIDIQWNGSAEGLLRSIAGQVGYDFPALNKPFSVHVRMKGDRISVRQALELIAGQLDGKADIHVAPNTKTIRLVVR